MGHPLTVDAERRALEIVEACIDLPPAERAAVVARECGDDRRLAARVETLAARAAQGDTILPDLAAELDIGTGYALPARIGNYRITGVLGQGGMGIVLRGERDDGVYEQSVAIKLIRRDLSGPHLADHFALERKILARLNHQAIARIYDGGQQDGQPYLVMELAEGEPITRYAAQRDLALTARIALFAKVCAAVQFAHRNLVVHADLKPSNIIVTPDHSVKLLDFGIARLVGDDAASQATGAGGYTRAYASPERRSGDAATVAGDVYSLGAILFELLTGALPERITLTEYLPSSQEALRVLQHPAWSPPSEAESSIHRKAIRGDLDAIVMKAVAADPAQRYPDVAALLADLDNHRTHQPVSAHPDGWRYRATKFAARHRQGLVIAATALALLTVTSVISTSLYVSAERARQDADARFADARGTARYLLFDLMAKLENQPRSLKLRAEVADVAQRYLDRLSRASQASDAVRFEAATGLRRLAEQQAKPGLPNLNQPDRADANLRKAEAIAANLKGGDAQILLANIQLDRVRLATEINTDTDNAEKLLANARASVDAASRHDPQLRGDYLFNLATLRVWQGRYPEGEAAARAALARPTAENSRTATLARAQLNDILAEAIYYGGAPGAAAEIYREQMRILEAAQQQWPDDNYVLQRLARARWNVGSTYLELDRFREALAVIEQAQTDIDTAVAFDPDDRETVRIRRIITSARAQALSLVGRSDEALAIQRAQAERDRRAWQGAPGEIRALRDYAYSMTVIGESLDTAGRRIESCAQDRAALALYDRLRQQGNATALDSDYNLKLAKERIGRNCP